MGEYDPLHQFAMDFKKSKVNMLPDDQTFLAGSVSTAIDSIWKNSPLNNGTQGVTRHNFLEFSRDARQSLYDAPITFTGELLGRNPILKGVKTVGGAVTVLARANMGGVAKFATAFSEHSSSDFVDLFGTGMESATRAVYSFDPKPGYDYGIYAQQQAMFSIKTSVRNEQVQAQPMGLPGQGGKMDYIDQASGAGDFSNPTTTGWDAINRVRDERSYLSRTLGMRSYSAPAQAHLSYFDQMNQNFNHPVPANMDPAPELSNLAPEGSVGTFVFNPRNTMSPEQLQNLQTRMDNTLTFPLGIAHRMPNGSLVNDVAYVPTGVANGLLGSNAKPYYQRVADRVGERYFPTGLYMDPKLVRRTGGTGNVYHNGSLQRTRVTANVLTPAGVEEATKLLQLSPGELMKRSKRSHLSQVWMTGKDIATLGSRVGNGGSLQQAVLGYMPEGGRGGGGVLPTTDELMQMEIAEDLESNGAEYSPYDNDFEFIGGSGNLGMVTDDLSEEGDGIATAKEYAVGGEGDNGAGDLSLAADHNYEDTIRQFAMGADPNTTAGAASALVDGQYVDVSTAIASRLSATGGVGKAGPAAFKIKSLGMRLAGVDAALWENRKGKTLGRNHPSLAAREYAEHVVARSSKNGKAAAGAVRRLQMNSRDKRSTPGGFWPGEPEISMSLPKPKQSFGGAVDPFADPQELTEIEGPAPFNYGYSESQRSFHPAGGYPVPEPSRAIQERVSRRNGAMAYGNSVRMSARRGIFGGLVHMSPDDPTPPANNSIDWGEAGGSGAGGGPPRNLPPVDNLFPGDDVPEEPEYVPPPAEDYTGEPLHDEGNLRTITPKMRAVLIERGYSSPEIDVMTPGEASAIIGGSTARTSSTPPAARAAAAPATPAATPAPRTWVNASEVQRGTPVVPNNKRRAGTFFGGKSGVISQADPFPGNPGDVFETKVNGTSYSGTARALSELTEDGVKLIGVDDDGSGMWASSAEGLPEGNYRMLRKASLDVGGVQEEHDVMYDVTIGAENTTMEAVLYPSALPKPADQEMPNAEFSRDFRTSDKVIDPKTGKRVQIGRQREAGSSAESGWSSTGDRATRARRQSGETATRQSRRPVNARILPSHNAESALNQMKNGGFRDSLIGVPMMNDEGEVAYFKPDENNELEMTATSREVNKGASAASAGYTTAAASMRDGAPKDMPSFAATLSKRVNEHIGKIMDEWEKSLTAEGMSSVDARSSREKAETLAKKVASSWVYQEIENMSPGASKDNLSGAMYHTTKVKNMEEWKAATESNPSLQSRQATSGRTPAEMMAAGDATLIEGDHGNWFELGTSRYSGHGRGGDQAGAPKSMWSGGMGKAMYGMYLAKRMWSMAIGPEIKTAGEYANFLDTEVSDVSRGMGIQGEGGFSARQSLGEMYMARGAYEQFGGLLTLPYTIGKDGNGAAARLISAGKSAFSLGSEVAIGGFLAGQMGMTGVATAAPALAAGVAGGIMLAAGGIEIANAFRSEDMKKLGFGTVFNGDEASANAVYSKAAAKYYGDEGSATSPLLAGVATLMSNIGGSMSGTGEVYTVRGEDDPNKQAIIDSMSASDRATYYGMRYKPGEKEYIAGTERLVELSGTTKEDAATAMPMIFKMANKKVDNSLIDFFGQRASALNVQSTDLLKSSYAYAATFGYTPGSEQFMYAAQAYAGRPEEEQYLLDEQAQRRGQFINSAKQFGSVQDTFATGQLALSSGVARSQQSYQQYASMANVAEQFYNGGLNLGQNAVLMQVSQDVNGYQAGVYSSIAQQGAIAGYDPVTMMTNLSDAGLTNQQASLVSQIAGGDLKAAAYAHYSGSLPSSSSAPILFDQSGRSIFQNNGAAGMSQLARMVSNPYVRDATPFGQSLFNGLKMGYLNGGSEAGTQRNIAQMVLGTDDKNILDAFTRTDGFGGFTGLQLRANQVSYDAQMAGVGIQMQGIALQKAHLWGQDNGGTYSNPAAGSSWHYEDMQRGYANQSQLTDFGVSRERMDLSNQFGIRRENTQERQMETSHSYNNWQASFNYSANLRGREWTQEDWGLQDNQRNLNYSWNMEDIQENLRFATGRQRRQLLKQRDRAAVSYNLEEEGVDNQRERQTQLWQDEDERFEKLREYTKEMQSIETENFNLQKEQRQRFYQIESEELKRREAEYKRDWQIQSEIIALNRKYQADQIALQERSAGIAAWQASEMKKINDAMAKGEPNINGLVGAYEELSKYNNAVNVANAMTAAGASLNTLRVDRINALSTLPTHINSLLPGKVAEIIALINAINNFSTPWQ